MVINTFMTINSCLALVYFGVMCMTDDLPGTVYLIFLVMLMAHTSVWHCVPFGVRLTADTLSLMLSILI